MVSETQNIDVNENLLMLEWDLIAARQYATFEDLRSAPTFDEDEDDADEDDDLYEDEEDEDEEDEEDDEDEDEDEKEDDKDEADDEAYQLKSSGESDIQP